jgi:glycosyltransferase involved in cell wall biosynthesis
MLIWNGILKNERAIIDRCINSLLPHIDGAVLVDTGSTDGTPERVMELFAAADKPVEFHFAPFENFSQARNEALRRARESKCQWDYLLLADADMEFKVTKPNWLNGAGGLSYDLYQTAGSIRYVNRRVVSRRATGNYVGPTHEYLDVPGDGLLDGAEFVDHADGANRVEKFSRDIALLEKALETEKNPGLIQRYHFYLGQSYFDLANWSKAAEHYKIRTTLGGFDEEVWNAQVHYAHCLANSGDCKGFLWEMLRAYQQRPTRAESLYDLAKFFREAGDNRISLLFSEPGLQITQPNDLLFVNHHVYDTGLKAEFAICAYYDPIRRSHGRALCDEIALSKLAPLDRRQEARANQYWYLRPLSQILSSFETKQIPFTPPEGWTAMNPSVVRYKGNPVVLLRTVNYRITVEGSYEIRGPDAAYSRDWPISTVNYLVHLDNDLNLVSSHELVLPANWPEPKFDLVRGLEDSRLFVWGDELWTLSCARELTAEGWCEQVLAPVSSAGYGDKWQVLRPEHRQHEKNWMPWAPGRGGLQFVYRLGVLVNTDGDEISRHDCKLDVGHISGGSQVIRVDGLYLALVHEARLIPGRNIRYYQHRFVMLEKDGSLKAISPPFYFHDRQIEFAAGLAYFPDRRQLLISYGVRDCEAWLAWVNLDEVMHFLLEGTEYDYGNHGLRADSGTSALGTGLP